MIWAGVSCFSSKSIITLKGRITQVKYREVLANQVHPIMKTLFPARNGIFLDDNVPIQTAGLVQSWFDEHEDVKHLPCPCSHPTAIELNR
ncbi:DDE_3 domain-containing protein [Trichonephila clavipes]|nr:DDE_3 domain-containing protein [Trichonephila clavipes]